MIFPGSRYQNTGTFSVSRCDGKLTVQALCLPLPGPATVLGYYRRSTGQRLDLIANAFLKDATTSWRLCDANNAVSPDALAAGRLVGIPMTTL
jgi:hypothetical protein